MVGQNKILKNSNSISSNNNNNNNCPKIQHSISDVCSLMSFIPAGYKETTLHCPALFDLHCVRNLSFDGSFSA